MIKFFKKLIVNSAQLIVNILDNISRTIEKILSDNE